MNMQLTHFKKAAKRFSTEASIPLSEAQEKLSCYFGFKNFDAAVKALSPAEPVGPTAFATAFWLDLSRQEFSVLVMLLMRPRNRPSSSLDEQCLFLTRTVLECIAEEGAITSAQDFLNWFDIEKLGEKITDHTRHGAPVSRAFQAVKSYFLSIHPGYLFELEAPPRPQIRGYTKRAKEGLIDLVGPRLLPRLQSIERFGSAEAVKSEKGTLKGMLAISCATKRQPADDAFDAVLRVLDESDLYSFG